jgi:hypothetical protein
MDEANSTHVKGEKSTLQLVRRCISCNMFRFLYVIYSEIHKYMRHYFCLLKEQATQLAQGEGVPEDGRMTETCSAVQ